MKSQKYMLHAWIGLESDAGSELINFSCFTITLRMQGCETWLPMMLQLKVEDVWYFQFNYFNSWLKVIKFEAYSLRLWNRTLKTISVDILPLLIITFMGKISMLYYLY